MLEIGFHKNTIDTEIAAWDPHHTFSALLYASFSRPAQPTVHSSGSDSLGHDNLPHLASLVTSGVFSTPFDPAESYAAYLSPTLFLSPSLPAPSQPSVGKSQSISSKTNSSASLFLGHSPPPYFYRYSVTCPDSPWNDCSTAYRPNLSAFRSDCESTPSYYILPSLSISTIFIAASSASAG